MSVSLRVTGTWAELTADGAVAIPATPQAGDRMYLFARWKDFSITATVANWTELTEFADGSTGSGNGTGSVKVGCWYRDWQSGDTNPTIDFSSSPTNASVVIMVMQKSADEVWSTPVARTAAMTNWTTSSQIVSASSTVAVPSGGVVMGLIGIRDDTATMTRPSTGIDVASGVTWNGDYVESPVTHHSTTTGDDGAADLGYRLVTLGGTVTLRMTGTISAAETGAALWVVQGTIIVVTPDPATLTVGGFAPTLKTSVSPPTASLSLTGFAPSIVNAVTPATQVLSLNMFTPSLKLAVVPSSLSLVLTTFAPTLWPPPPPLITPTAFWNMRFVGEDIIDPYGAFSLSSGAPPTAADMDLAAGKIGHAVTLDPVEGDYLTGADGLSTTTTGDFGLWFWVRRTTTGTNVADLLHIVNDTGEEFGILWGSDDGMDITGGDFGVASIVVPSDGDWHLVVIQYDANAAEIFAYVDNVQAVANELVVPLPGDNARWTWGNTDAVNTDYDGGPIDIDAAGFDDHFLSSDERNELWGQDGEGREYAPDDPALLPRQSLAQDSTTNVSDDMDGTPPASYELQSTIDAAAGATVKTTISNSTTGAAGGEVPQQQVITESTGGDELGRATVPPGEEISAKVEVTGDDVNMELRRTDE